ncbi:hypothetical protein COO60DRAFT_1551702 [Scenedesmus sp. NREL 46B-D3]|nr:hypothetical protein COO60DRAFT_1551702 [Scenedesmus sp. NREL 46B-D3]
MAATCCSCKCRPRMQRLACQPSMRSTTQTRWSCCRSVETEDLLEGLDGVDVQRAPEAAAVLGDDVQVRARERWGSSVRCMCRYSLQVNPITGRGPAWANPLFEDNAQFGLGIHMGLKHRRTSYANAAKALLADGSIGSTELHDALGKWLQVRESIFPVQSRLCTAGAAFALSMRCALHCCRPLFGAGARTVQLPLLPLLSLHTDPAAEVYILPLVNASLCEIQCLNVVSAAVTSTGSYNRTTTTALL